MYYSLTSWTSSEKYSLSCLTGRHLEALCSCHSCRGQTRKGKSEFPCPHGAAFSAPLHPNSDLVTPPSFNLEAFTEKAVCGKIGKCTILPGSKCTLKADCLEGPPGGGSLREFDPRGLRKGMVGPPSLLSGVSQTNLHLFPGKQSAHKPVSSVPSSSEQ